MAKVVNGMLGIFYHSGKEKKKRTRVLRLPTSGFESSPSSFQLCNCGQAPWPLCLSFPICKMRGSPFYVRGPWTSYPKAN